MFTVRIPFVVADSIIQDQRFTFEFTHDEALLQEYFKIREKVYVETFDIKDFSTHDDGYDNQNYTDILVVKCNDQVVGGSRLTFHYPDTDTKLPMEHDDFLLATIFPDWHLRKRCYVEVTRMVVLPEYRKSRDIGSWMIGWQVARAIHKGADNLFSVTPAIQGRNNRWHFQRLGYEMQTSDVEVPDTEAYDGKKMYLAVTDIKDTLPLFLQTVSSPAAAEKIVA